MKIGCANRGGNRRLFRSRGRDFVDFGRKVHFPRHRRLGRFREFENVVPDQVWDRQRGRFTELTGVEEAEFVAKPNIHRVEYRGEEVSETRAAHRLRQPETDESGRVQSVDGFETFAEN